MLEHRSLFLARHYIRRRKQFIRELLAIFRPSFCLDLACGSGTYFELFGLCKAVGVDLSADACVVAKEKGTAYVVRADARNLPFRESVFDFIISLGLLHHQPIAMTRIVGEIQRTMSARGTLVLDEPNGYNPLWRMELRRSRIDTAQTHLINPRRLEKMLIMNGFVICSRTFYGFVYPEAINLEKFELLVEKTPLRIIAIRIMIVAKRT
jgi:SAM-dependent methyltransferase